MWAHVSNPPPSLAECRPELAPALDPVLSRGLAKRPVAASAQPAGAASARTRGEDESGRGGGSGGSGSGDREQPADDAELAEPAPATGDWLVFSGAFGSKPEAAAAADAARAAGFGDAYTREVSQ